MPAGAQLTFLYFSFQWVKRISKCNKNCVSREYPTIIYLSHLFIINLSIYPSSLYQQLYLHHYQSIFCLSAVYPSIHPSSIYQSTHYPSIMYLLYHHHLSSIYLLSAITLLYHHLYIIICHLSSPSPSPLYIFKMCTTRTIYFIVLYLLFLCYHIPFSISVTKSFFFFYIEPLIFVSIHHEFFNQFTANGHAVSGKSPEKTLWHGSRHAV